VTNATPGVISTTFSFVIVREVMTGPFPPPPPQFDVHAGGGVPPPHVVQMSCFGLIVITTVWVVVPHGLLAEATTENVPEAVGVPEMVFPENESPAGNDEVATVYVIVVDAVVVAESVNEKAFSTSPDVVVALVNTGSIHAGASAYFVTITSVCSRRSADNVINPSAFTFRDASSVVVAVNNSGLYEKKSKILLTGTLN